EDGRAGYFLKLHHSLTDGQGGVQLLSLLHSRKRAPSPEKPMPDPPEPEHVTPQSVLAEQLVQRVRQAPRDAVDIAARAGRGLAASLTRPGALLGESMRMSRS